MPDTAAEIVHYQSRIEEMLMRRASFSQIEDMIEAVDTLDTDQKAALWLYAWSSQPLRDQRREARAMLELVTGA